MLGQFFRHIFPKSSKKHKELLQKWVADIQWNNLEEFKLSCNAEQVKEHYQGYQAWHYEWSDKNGEKFHMTLLEQKSNRARAQTLQVRGHHNERPQISYECPLPLGEQGNVTPFKNLLPSPEKMPEKVDEAVEILGNMQQLNREFIQFLLEDLIHTVKPVEKKKQGQDYRSDETRGLEWARVSYDLLSKALDEAINNPQELQQEWSLSWSKSSDETEVRLLAFNLDTLLTASADDPLDVAIYDHKNFKKPVSETSFIGQFEYGAGDFLELFSHLIKKLQ